MATAEVVTVLSNQYSSFKIANLGAPIGAFEQDRAAGIQGRIGAVAPMMPLTLRWRRRAPRAFHMRLAERAAVHAAAARAPRPSAASRRRRYPPAPRAST